MHVFKHRACKQPCLFLPLGLCTCCPSYAQFYVQTFTWLASLFLNSHFKSHLLTKIFPSFPIESRCSLFPPSVPLTPFPVLISPLHFPLPTVIAPVAYPFKPVFTQLDWRHFVPHIDLALYSNRIT